MEIDKENFNSQFKETILKVFEEFMARVSEFDELVAAGSRLLTSFQQGLEFLRRPPLDESSELVKNIINANKTKRLQSYLAARCIKTCDSVQNISKCQIILEQLESLLNDVTGMLRIALGNLPPLFDSIEGGTTAEEEEEVGSSCALQGEASDRALLMAIICNMVKQDFTMQERIVSTLNLNSSSSELESYCLMWSLRPFINDSIMAQAWKLIP